uniref:Uncharacterized protein n=1 Tax=Ralstonia solanacearum TaxID=305 RepID=A0A0S4U8V9_RALSL|nr:protein of unknown function [Ralstonia solanacearum]CUV45679.1 protein of unknown function [Ralstonia solanacearum]
MHGMQEVSGSIPLSSTKMPEGLVQGNLKRAFQIAAKTVIVAVFAAADGKRCKTVSVPFV